MRTKEQPTGTIFAGEPIALPRSPEDAASGSTIARLVAQRQDYWDSSDPIRQRLTALQRQAAGYRRIIDGATPESDMGAVAAALAGTPIVAAASAPLGDQLDMLLDGAQGVQRTIDATWARCRALHQKLAEARRTYDGWPAWTDDARDELRTLCGC